MRNSLFLILFSLFLFPVSTFPQGSNYWIQCEGSPNADENLDIAKDNNNNVISVGYFTNTITFPSGSTLTSAGSGTSDVLIEKTNPQGTVIWSKRAGGLGSDRGISVQCDASGDIYITGYYFGTAQFGSITLNSVGGSQDIFIAKLNAAGTFIWAISAGGPLGEDPYALTLDNLGNIAVTGEFEGTSVFGTQTLVSVTNPYTHTPSFDVFTCKYDPNGNFLWVQQGSAHLNDRGMDLASDANGNIFVCGQFSDTITFGATHLNTIQNAVFIIKYNSAGQEQWFVRAGGISSISYGLTIDNNNDVYVTGDFTGNIMFFGISNNSLTGAFSNRIFLVKYDNNGQWLWGRSDASNSYVSSKDIALDANQNPCMYGEFDCKMNDYSIFAGGTGMFNSVGFHDIFLAQYSGSGTRLWARNFGGPLNDYAHGLVFTNNITPYVCGSYNYYLEVDTKYSPFSVLNYFGQSASTWVSSQNCNNSNSDYFGVNAAGASDCFILHGVDSTTPYYDYYYRNGTGCQKNLVKGCIDNYTYNCKDTITFCGSGNLTANPYTGTIGQVGPFYHYQWNNGDTLASAGVTASGNYSCVMTTMDGCFTTQDTVYVKINPDPQPPTITDNLGINVNQLPATNPIIICGSGTFTLTAGNLQGCTFQWTGPGIISTFGSSCVVNQAGTYNIVLTNSLGCTNWNNVTITFATLDHVVPKTNMPDTVTICANSCINYFVFDSLTNPTGINPYNPFPTLVHVVSNNNMVQSCWCNSNLSLTICPTSTGWINFGVWYVFSSTCGKDSVYFHNKIYIKIKPLPVAPLITLNLSGSPQACPGDSTLITASFTVTPSTHIFVTSSTPSSMWVQPGGSFSFYVLATDTLNGCTQSSYVTQNIFVSTTPNPVISINPSSGIVCPNDSVKLTCTYSGGVTWQWYGPSGLINSNSPFIYEHIPGFYYCVATNSNGCKLTSNTVEIQNYNTPYILALPQAISCNGSPITLQVQTEDSTNLQWLPPLSGGGTIRTVTQTGTYSCLVSMCNITTTCSIHVTIVNTAAHITIVGSSTICPGDSVLLIANTGMQSYQWLPTNQNTDSIFAYASGNYLLLVTDTNGCQALDSIHVIYNPSAPPSPSTTNDSICAGTVANLSATATGTNTVQWFNQQYSGSVINTGNYFTTPILYSNTTYYVSTMNSSGCHSVRQPAFVFIKPTSVMPVISATQTVICAGDSLFLHSQTVAGATYNWSGPNGFTSPQNNPIIANVGSAASGTYFLFLKGDSCTSPADSLHIAVTTVNLPLIIVSVDSVCEGSSISLAAQSNNSGASYYWHGPNGFTSSSSTFTLSNVGLSSSGTYSLQASVGNCMSPIATGQITIKPLPTTSLRSNPVLCSGDSLILNAAIAPVGTQVMWTGPNGYHSVLPKSILIPASQINNGYYVCTSSLDGCTIKDSVKELINTMPASATTNSLICGNEVNINVTNPLALSYLWNDGNTDSVHAIYSTGIYWITYHLSTSCIYSDTIYITVKDNQLRGPLPNIVTPNNDQINDFIDFGKYTFSTFSIVIFNRWGNLIFESTDPNCIWRPDCIDGTYFYLLKYQISCGSENDPHQKEGYFTIIR